MPWAMPKARLKLEAGLMHVLSTAWYGGQFPEAAGDAGMQAEAARTAVPAGRGGPALAFHARGCGDGREQLAATTDGAALTATGWPSRSARGWTWLSMTGGGAGGA